MFAGCEHSPPESRQASKRRMPCSYDFHGLLGRLELLLLCGHKCSVVMVCGIAMYNYQRYLGGADALLQSSRKKRT